MNDVYQHSKADGDPDWNEGRPNFAREWEVVGDLARFHRGRGFRLKIRGDEDKDYGPTHRLNEVRDRMAHVLAHRKPGTVVQFRSEDDDAWSMLMRRVVVETGGDRVVDYAVKRLGVPYKLGTSGPSAYDCSGLTMKAYATVGVDLVHKASIQHDRFRGGVSGFIPIGREKVKPGDLIFSNDDDHVAIYYGTWRDTECVIDTEPSDTSAPWGGRLGTGIQYRPMTGNYYNSWSRVNGVGRIVSVNGPV